MLKRLQASQTVIVAIDGFDRGERERYVRMAHGARAFRPRRNTIRNAAIEALS